MSFVATSETLCFREFLSEDCSSQVSIIKDGMSTEICVLLCKDVMFRSQMPQVVGHNASMSLNPHIIVLAQ